MSAPVGGDEWNVGRTEWNVHARCQHPLETKSLTLGSQFSRCINYGKRWTDI